MSQIDSRATSKIIPVILCGGSGTRLWPLSRSSYPKQFIPLTSSETLFQQAVLRCQMLSAKDHEVMPSCLLAHEDFRFLVKEQLREIDVTASDIVLEPSSKNTAPAITLAALAALETDSDSILAVFSADHVFTDLQAFGSAFEQAVAQARENKFVIFGITPESPETGYGYIKADKKVDGSIARQVECFVEKPDITKAKEYVSEGGYFWNSGMFVMKASLLFETVKLFRPQIADFVSQAWKGKTTDQLGFVRPDSEAYAKIKSESIDYAVMEQLPQSDFPLCLVPLDAGWSDVGSWDAVWNTLEKDNAGNAKTGDVFLSESNESLAYSSSRLVSLVGVKNTIVIETPDAVLVADKSASQQVKNIVNTLKEQNREEASLHRQVYRPWGWYDSVDEGDNFKVKRIQVKPGEQLSLQRHKHRSEHWVVVKGIAEVTKGKETTLLEENQSVYIPRGEIHRLANPGSEPLEIIEVQTGSYLGEDDIERLDDKYGR